MENFEDPLLKVNRLQISFPQLGILRKVVKSIDFELESGKTLGLVGESGSGKSVTALALMGLLGANAQVEGEIYLGDKNLIHLSENDFRSVRGSVISMIFQEPMSSLNPVLSLGDQVSEVLRLHLKMSSQSAKKETIRMFNEVELPRAEALYSSYPHQLSGGQRQRVMIAMALATNPKILIADEPTTALDVTVQKTIIDLLLKVKSSRGMSMIFISHDLGLVSQVADKVLVLYQGNIVERGATQELFQTPKHPYTRGLLACRPTGNQDLRRLPVISDFMVTDSGGIIHEKNGSIEEVENNLKRDPGVIKKRRDLLYAQPPLIKVHNLSKQFRGIKAVNEVSFQVFPGEILGLVGESGCGKSTLGRSILRLIEPDSGEIFYRGNNLIQLSKSKLRESRRHLQFIFQDPFSSLNPRQTIGQTLMEPLKVFDIGENENERRELALSLLNKVQLLPEHFNRYPHEFSGGQRQRIGIARSLSVSPEFIICDESVSALDVSIQAQIINLLMDLREELNLTLIFISHDLSVVRFISDRILVMNKGQFEEEGSPDEIYFNPKTSYTKRLIEAIPKTNW